MIRSAVTAVASTAVLAALAGCASQDTFGLPDLAPRGAPPTPQVYPSYGAGDGYGYGYPHGYRPGYGYADPYYAAPGPYPYAYAYEYGYGYNPYPRYVVVPCADNNRDGRCDSRPPKDRDRYGNGHDGGHNGDPGRDDPPRAVPAAAPVAQQPARVRPESRRALPPDATAPRGPRVGRGRPATTGDDVAVARPSQEP